MEQVITCTNTEGQFQGLSELMYLWSECVEAGEAEKNPHRHTHTGEERKWPIERAPGLGTCEHWHQLCHPVSCKNVFRGKIIVLMQLNLIICHI